MSLYAFLVNLLFHPVTAPSHAQEWMIKAGVLKDRPDLAASICILYPKLAHHFEDVLPKVSATDGGLVKIVSPVLKELELGQEIKTDDNKFWTNHGFDDDVARRVESLGLSYEELYMYFLRNRLVSNYPPTYKGDERMNITYTPPYLVFDIETTGLPKLLPGRESGALTPALKFPAMNELSQYDQSRLVQISWQLCGVPDEKGVAPVMKKVVEVVRLEVDVVSIPPEASKIHKITDEIVAERGVPLSKIAAGFERVWF
jgi:hypothetical protein